jgi:nitrogen regulatory protein PII
MKRIEAVIRRSSYDDFQRCVKQLGIFGFDLCEEDNQPARRKPQLIASHVSPPTVSKLKVDFAVPDEDANPTVHAVLESADPCSIGIFKFEQNPV